MDEHGRHEREEPVGLNDAYAINLKMVIERMQALMEERQGQMNRLVEDTLSFRKALDTQYLSDIAEIREMGHEARHRKELDSEERAKELQEAFNKVVTAGANQQNAATNEAIAGIVAILQAAGLMGAVVGASQQTSGKTKGTLKDF